MPPAMQSKTTKREARTGPSILPRLMGLELDVSGFGIDVAVEVSDNDIVGVAYVGVVEAVVEARMSLIILC